MRRKPRRRKRVTLIKKITRSPLFKKIVGYFSVAIASYIFNYFQTIAKMNQLRTDNADLSWAVDYFRQ